MAAIVPPWCSGARVLIIGRGRIVAVWYDHQGMQVRGSTCRRAADGRRRIMVLVAYLFGRPPRHRDRGPALVTMLFCCAGSAVYVRPHGLVSH